MLTAEWIKRPLLLCLAENGSHCHNPAAPKANNSPSLLASSITTTEKTQHQHGGEHIPFSTTRYNIRYLIGWLILTQGGARETKNPETKATSVKESPHQQTRRLKSPELR
jgi:hypothetical protein